MVLSDVAHLESTEAQNIILAARKEFNCTLQRNNAGAMRAPSGQWMRFGLGNESPNKWKVFRSSDYIGPTVVTVTQEMVGKKIAIFTAIETKKPDWVPRPTDEREIAQGNYIDWVKSIGGFAGFANGVDSLRKIFSSL